MALICVSLNFQNDVINHQSLCHHYQCCWVWFHLSSYRAFPEEHSANLVCMTKLVVRLDPVEATFVVVVVLVYLYPEIEYNLSMIYTPNI